MTPEEAGKPSLGAGEAAPLGLFRGIGVEVEMMIVDAETLSVAPVADRLLERLSGAGVRAEVALGELAASNELALHVVELKTNGPAAGLDGLAVPFRAAVARLLTELEPMGARLMPGGMHPWMDPARDLRLWPHEYDDVYRAFDRIFGCSGHGWANLQSTHLNFPFADDREFGLLHRAIRIALPLLPALAAGSPVRDGVVAPELDARLAAYRGNTRRVPSVTGRVIPEPVHTRAAYERDLLGRIYRDLAPLDPEGILRHEWVNARGAIARFDRGSVEVRVLDAQECPASDLAVAAATTGLVRHLALERLPGVPTGDDPDTELLADLLERTERDAERAEVGAPALLDALGLPRRVATAADAWRALADAGTLDPVPVGCGTALELILEEGPLSRRILRALGAPEPGDRPGRDRLRGVYGELCGSLERDEPFRPS